MNNLLSVIIPVYNVEAYLAQCLESVRNQSYENWECILVDDGSTDNSGHICDQYADVDKRFKVFHIENHGRSNARNFGIEHSSGDYITFIDSDDYISGKTYEEVFRQIQVDKADICCYGMKRVSDDKELSSVEFRNTDTVKNFIHYDVYMHSVCNKVFRRGVITDNHICFHTELSVCEDMLFTFTAIALCNKVGYLNADYYMYRVKEASQPIVAYSQMELRDFKSSYIQLKRFCDERGLSNKYRMFLRYRELYYAILFLIRPEYYSPKDYRANRSRFNYWTYSFRMDYFILSFCSAIHFDFPAKVFCGLKKRRG